MMRIAATTRTARKPNRKSFAPPCPCHSHGKEIRLSTHDTSSKNHHEKKETSEKDGHGDAGHDHVDGGGIGAGATTSYTVTAYKWAGFTGYDTPVEMTITDDDDQLDWFGQDTGQAETAEIDGQTHGVKWSGTIETEFTDSDGTPHVEEVVYTYTSDGYYVIPMTGSAFDEGSTIKGFKDGWSDTDGIAYDEVICFTPSCRIDTDRGPVAAGMLRPGDRVQTADNGYQPLRWIGRSDLPGLARTARNLHPVRIRAHAFGPGRPARDIAVSPQHRFCLGGGGLVFHEDELLAPAKGLVDGARVLRDRATGGVSYLHLLFDRHEVIFCEGVATESFQPTRRNLGVLSRRARTALLREIGPLTRDYRAARPVLHPWEAALLARDMAGLSRDNGLVA